MLLKIGFFSYPPYSYLGSDGRPTGATNEYWMRAFSFAFQALNFTAIPINLNREDALSLYQKVDYVPLAACLPELTPNITTGPVLRDISCYIGSRPAKGINFKLNRFENTFQSLDSITSWMSVLLLFVLFFLLFCSQKWRRRKKNKLIHILWTYLGLFLRNVSSKKIAHLTKSIVLVSLVFFFLIQTIFLSYIHTGMVEISDFSKLSTMKQVIQNRIRPLIFDFSSCRFLIPVPKYDSTGLSLRTSLIDFQSDDVDIRINHLVEMSNQECILGTQGDMDMFRELACLFVPFMRYQYYLSSERALQYPWNLYSRHQMNPKLKEKLFRFGSSTFEMGINEHNPPLSVDQVRVVMNSKADSKCLDDSKIKETIDWTPIKMIFTLQTFFVHIVTIGLAMVLHLLIGLYYSYKRAKKINPRNIMPGTSWTY